jgi:hypothetical protein
MTAQTSVQDTQRESFILVGLKVKTRAHASHFAYSLAARVFFFTLNPPCTAVQGIAHTQLISSLTKIAEDASII